MKYVITLLALTLLAFSTGKSAAGMNDQRILFLGDSLTSGAYASYEQATFVSIVGEQTGYRVARKHAATLINAETAWVEIKGWLPNYIVLEIGLNDVSRRPIESDDEWLSRYTTLVRAMKDSGATIVVCTPFWAGIPKNHKDYQRYLDYREMILAAANSEKVIAVDLWSVTEGCTECVSRPEQLSYFSPGYKGDNFHPNDYGHSVIASEILKALHREYYFPIMKRG